MTDKLWIDDICQLLSLEFNPIGTPLNTQINIITKMALLISVATSIVKKNSSSLKRTIAFVSVLMLIYIIVNAFAKPKQVLEVETPFTERTRETFTVDKENPVGNPQLSTSPELSSPATGRPGGSLVSFEKSSKILGCSLDTDDWDNRRPNNDDTRENLTNSALVLSPEIEAALTHNIPMDPSDEFYGANFSRQIYKVPDDQGNYASQLYEQGARQHCKQGSVFAHLGNPYTVYTRECTPDNGYGQARRSGLYLPPKKA
tara:strand:- start:8237 stop:9013 length:777 start_codon:yes stop_codon:yes gene_type:complete